MSNSAKNGRNLKTSDEDDTFARSPLGENNSSNENGIMLHVIKDHTAVHKIQSSIGNMHNVKVFNTIVSTANRSEYLNFKARRVSV